MLLGAVIFLWVLPLHAQTAEGGKTELISHLQTARTALKTNDQAAATREFDAVLKFDPANAEAHANLGVMAFFRGDCMAAEPDFQRALHTDASLTKVQALLGICEKRAAQPDAQTDLENSFAKLDDPKLRTQVGMEMADLFYQRGDLERTASVLHTVLDIYPNNVDVLFFAQRVYSALADDTLNKLAALAPQSARMEQMIAERQINAGNLKGATAHYRNALQLNPKLPGMHFELAEALLEASPNDAATRKEARAELTAAMELDGDSSRLEDELGRVALLESNRTDALAHYQRAYQMNPHDPGAAMGMAELLRMDNKLEEAASYLHTAIAADPFNAEAHYRLAQTDRRLHLDVESEAEMKLFQHIRATKDSVKLLYREMNASPAPSSESGAAPQPKTVAIP